MDSPAYFLLLYVVIPVWLLAGFLDWVQHVRYSIATTSGPTESVFHLLLLAEMGIPVTLVLLFEVSTLSFAVFLCACLLHTATAYADTRYAEPRRRIGCFEQLVHGYLEVLPYTALLLLASEHWDEFIALFGSGMADWSLRLRDESTGMIYLAAAGTVALIMVVLPFAEEFVRGKRARRTYIGLNTIR